jgi:hypothetical protein
MWNPDGLAGLYVTMAIVAILVIGAWEAGRWVWGFL